MENAGLENDIANSRAGKITGPGEYISCDMSDGQTHHSSTILMTRRCVLNRFHVANSHKLSLYSLLCEKNVRALFKVGEKSPA